MHRTILIILTVISLWGCSTTHEGLVGEPVYFRDIGDDVFWENIVVYGELQMDILSKPTDIYNSSFGHAYCMSEEVTFKVYNYLLGSGPKVINYSQNIIDQCRPVAENIGFDKAVLFLSKNKYRGIWSTGSVPVHEIDGKSQIFRPRDIVQFLIFESFDSLLSNHEEPIEWGVEVDLLPEESLKKLKEKGVLSYKLNTQDENSSYYLVEMYKYISLEALGEKYF